VKRLLSAEERAAMEQSIASAPEAHPVVAGTGGVRKARWGRQGKGKRGGEKTDLTAQDRKTARLFVEAIENEKEARH
jgi:hypothetical protein